MTRLQALYELVLVPYLPSPPRSFTALLTLTPPATGPLHLLFLLLWHFAIRCPQGPLPHSVSSEAAPGHSSVAVTCSLSGLFAAQSELLVIFHSQEHSQT